MKYQLVLQWSASSIDDYDSVIELEEQLIHHLTGNDAEVDGHDAGSGQVNIFIQTDHPERAFTKVREVLADNVMLGDIRAAFREIGGSEYEILWPKSLKEFSVT
jgi:hypothetical protein